LDLGDHAPACAAHVAPYSRPTQLPRVGEGMWRGLRHVVAYPGRTKYGVAKAVAGARAVKAGYPAVDRLVSSGLIVQSGIVDGRPVYEATPLGHRTSVYRSAA
jgi:hypothetical protein